MVLPLKLCTPKGYNGFGATMQDNLQYDDETIAATLKVKHISVRSMPQVSKVGRSNHVIVQDEVGGCACISAIQRKTSFPLVFRSICTIFAARTKHVRIMTTVELNAQILRDMAKIAASRC